MEKPNEPSNKTDLIEDKIELISLPRRTANYKPNIWSYDQLMCLTNECNGEKYKVEAKALKNDVYMIFNAVENPLCKLEFIDRIRKLALSQYFVEEISEALQEIACMNCTIEDNYASKLCFRVLRQYYGDSQDVKLASDDECLFNRIIQFDRYSANYPLDRTVEWYNVKRHINRANDKSILLRLARLNFNMVQSQHQKDLKDILRWWRDIGLSEVLTFTRDRIVESFLWAVGVAYEPQYTSLRKWLTKAIMLVLIIDDLYDIYGSKQELEQFTSAVERWDVKEIQPSSSEAIRRCFFVLIETTNDIDFEIQKEKGCNSVLPHLKKVWTDLCKAMLVEANWYHTGHTPSLRDYLHNGWISSSGPLLSLHILFGVGQNLAEINDVFNTNHNIILHTSLIIRLCNDQGTSQAELERGDAPSSILCYMREENATEEEARDYVGYLINQSWKKLNGLYIETCHSMIRYIINTARVANFIYQNGDGFGVQDRETREQVLSCLIHPLPLC